MTLVSVKTGTENNTNLFKIELSDGSKFKIKEFYLNYFLGTPLSTAKTPSSSKTDDFFKEGRDISPNEEKAFRFSSACCKAEKAGSRLIARAEQNQNGLTKKLIYRGHDKECISAVLAWFVETEMVNDRRYAERWLRSRLSRKSGKISGPRRLSAALGNKGIGREALWNAFDTILDEETEFSLLERFLSKKRMASLSGNTLKSRLRYEGFTSSVINRYFNEAIE